MNAADVKVGMKVIVESTDSITKGYNGATGIVQEIVEDEDDEMLMGNNIIVLFDKQYLKKFGRGAVVGATDIKPV